VGKRVHVQFLGGREVVGTLRGYDQLVNIVLDDTVEFLRSSDTPDQSTDKTRKLGLVVARGTSVMLVYPAEGMEEIDNPYEQGNEAEA